MLPFGSEHLYEQKFAVKVVAEWIGLCLAASITIGNDKQELTRYFISFMNFGDRLSLPETTSDQCAGHFPGYSTHVLHLNIVGRVCWWAKDKSCGHVRN